MSRRGSVRSLSVAAILRLARHPGYLRPIVRWYGATLCLWIARRLRRQTPAEFATRFMSTSTPNTPTPANNTAEQASAPAIPPKTRYLLLVRHGQTTFNVEGRLPGQLPGVPLTDEGRRQAHRAAIALAALPLTTIISSPLERAADTAEIIARGWGLTVRTDPRLMDTNVGHWAGQKIDEVARNDPAWKVFTANPDEPPAGVESFSQVQARAVAAARDALADPANGEYIVLVAHGDVVKLILAQYMNTPIPCVPYLTIANASISGLAFTGEAPPQILATNWTPDPRWLVAPATPAPPTPEAPQTDLPAERNNSSDKTSTNPPKDA
ncbi:MAG TPA: histidine phosphatase family protein [Ktedonobacterales bacterium]|nr:histidine phosphatase family protein [Ktedonobacterales bacterium]